MKLLLRFMQKKRKKKNKIYKENGWEGKQPWTVKRRVWWINKREWKWNKKSRGSCVAFLWTGAAPELEQRWQPAQIPVLGMACYVETQLLTYFQACFDASGAKSCTDITSAPRTVWDKSGAAPPQKKEKKREDRKNTEWPCKGGK